MNPNSLGNLWFKPTIYQVVFPLLIYKAALEHSSNDYKYCGTLYFPQKPSAIFLAPHVFPEPCLSSHQKVEFNFISLWTRVRLTDALLTNAAGYRHGRDAV